MRTTTFNYNVITKDSATKRSKSCGNLHKSAFELNQGDYFVDQVNRSNSKYVAPRNDSPNFISRIILFGLMTLLLSPLSFAQDFDTNRMNRDIKIMESVLGEIFKTKIETSGNSNTNKNFAYTISGFRSDEVTGTYIPGYGIIFKIPSPTSSSINIVRRNSDSDVKVVFGYQTSEDKEQAELTEETVTNRIVEFLADYGSTIGQLKDNERVMVMYGEKSPSRGQVRFFNLSGNEKVESENKPIPVISVSATQSDLKALRSGRINKEKFRDRLSITTSEQTEEALDLKVMANIFQTAFESEHKLALINDDPTEAFRLMGNVGYQQLDDFGVIFSMNARYANNTRLTAIELRAASSSSNLDTIDSDNITNIRINTNSDSAKQSAWTTYAKNSMERSTKAFAEFKDQLKQYLVDYGRTLRSVNTDELILLSVDIIGVNMGNLPESLQFQIKKSTLEDFDAGKVSRDEAINAVTITES